MPRRGSLSNIFSNVKTKLHREKSNSPHSSSDESYGTTFSLHTRSGHSSGTSSGTDTDGSEVPGKSAAAKAPQLEALSESPPPTLKGSAFAEAFDKAADDIKTKYDSFPIKYHSSFNPNLIHALPIRRKTKTQRLVSGSKSLFRAKTQRKSRSRGSDRRSSATLEAREASDPAEKTSNPPNWESVRPDEQIAPEEPLAKRSISAEKRHDISFDERQSSPKRRVASINIGTHSLQRQGAIYLTATAREEIKLAEDMRRRQAKLENLRNWPFESSINEVPNIAESSTEESPCLVAEQPSPGEVFNTTESLAEQWPCLVAEGQPCSENALDEPSNASDEEWEQHSESFYARLEAMGHARDALDTPTQELEITSLPFDQGSVESLPLVELSPSKVGDPDYQGSLDGSHAQKCREAMDEAVHDIQEPTSTFTYIPVAILDPTDIAGQNNKQRAEIAAAISTRKTPTNPFSTSPNPFLDDGELAVAIENFCDGGSISSTSATLNSKFGASEDD